MSLIWLNETNEISLEGYFIGETELVFYLNVAKELLLNVAKLYYVA